MELDVLKTTVHFSRWRSAETALSLSFDVVPKERDYIEIGEDYLFCASGYAPMRSKERTLIGASLSITDNPEVLENLAGLFPGETQGICGAASFYPQRNDPFDPDPAKIYFTVVVEPEVFAQMLRESAHRPGGLTLNLSLEGLDFGWEPDASHLIWKTAEGGRDQRPISSFRYSVERFWTSERAVHDERDRQLKAELADSHDPQARKLAAIDQAPPDYSVTLLQHCRSLLVLLLLVGVAALLRL